MPFSIRLPIHTAERIVAPGGVAVTIRAYQPVVWVKLASWEAPEESVGVAFPAVLDTGNNHFFLIPGSLFRSWTGIDSATIRPDRRVIANGVLVGCYPYHIGLMRVRAGQPTETLAGRLRADHGIVVIPEDQEARFPRMPVLGVRTLCFNRVTFTLNGARQAFTLSQARPAAT